MSDGKFDFTDGYVYEKTFTDYVTYEEFGAVGDGKTDDFAAIVKAHEYANSNGLSVFANETRCRKALHTTIVTTYGLVKNEYSGYIQNVVTMDSLFD